MKFKITLTPSNYYQDAKKSKYLNPVIIESLEDFKKVILKDYACAVYKDNHRSIDDFLYADAIVFDIDNDHSENPDDWITPDKVSSFFDDVPIYIQYSRNHMKIKNGKPARPKFHIIMPIDKVTDAKEYRAMKEKVYSIFPFVDGQALDSARLLFGTAEPKVDYIDRIRTLTDFLKEYDDETKFAQLGEIIPEGSRNKTKDTSKKIRAVFKSKGESEKPLSTNAPYGYIKDPNDKFHWIIDEEAAEVVKEIFNLCISGYGTCQIAKILQDRGIESPCAHSIKCGGSSASHGSKITDDTYWNGGTIYKILDNIEYLGHTINFKTFKKSYKVKKTIKNDPSKYMIFENTHEPIITQEVFDAVKRIRMGRRRRSNFAEKPLFDGLVFCSDCGHKLYQVRGKKIPRNEEYLVCGRYSKYKECSSHSIRNVVLEEIVLHDLNRVLSFASNHEKEFIKLVTSSTQAELDKTARQAKREYESAMARINKLDSIIQKLYEDNLEGKISDERFQKMTESYELEQKSLQARVKEIETQLSSIAEQKANTTSFISTVKSCTEVKELDAKTLRIFIEKIIVHQKEKIDGVKTQKVEIIYNGIGKIQIPQEKA